MARHTIQWWIRKIQPPVAPAVISLTGTATSITADWDPVAHAVEYTLQRSPNGTTGWVDVYTGYYTHFVNEGLTANTAYWYRVRARNSIGEYSPYSPVASGVTSGVATPPAAPTTAPVATDRQAASLTIAYDAVTGATAYVLQKSLNGTVWSDLAVDAALSYTDGGLNASSTYFYRYAARNSDGTSAFSPVLETTTTAATTAQRPADPTSAPTITGTSASSVSLTMPAVTGATSYTLQRSADGTTGWASLVTQAGQSYTNTGLSSGTTYYYRYAASNAIGQSLGWSPTASATTDTVVVGPAAEQPIAASVFRARCGIDVHANFGGTVYDGSNADWIIGHAAATGVSYIRSNIVPGSADTAAYIAACRKYGVGWLMTVVPAQRGVNPSTPIADVQAKVRTIASSYADVCVGLEGYNEINNIPDQTNWPTLAVDYQRAIYQTARSLPALDGAAIVGPSLHAPHADANPDWDRLKAAGILPFQDAAGVHSYPNGYTPRTALDARVAAMRAAYGAGYDFWLTESGYSNNIGGTGNPVTRATSATYIPRMFLQIGLDIGAHISYYESHDDPDPTGTNREASFGWWAVTSTSSTSFTDKPTVASVTAMLARFKEPATVGSYTPAKVAVKVSSTAADVKYHLVATKAQSTAGIATVLVYRNLPVNNKANTSQNVTVSPVGVTITDRAGARTFQVDGDVTAVDLR